MRERIVFKCLILAIALFFYQVAPKCIRQMALLIVNQNQ